MSRPFSASSFRQQQEQEADAAEVDNGEEAGQVAETTEKQQKRRIVDVHTSMRYLRSKGSSFNAQDSGKLLQEVLTT